MILKNRCDGRFNDAVVPACVVRCPEHADTNDDELIDLIKCVAQVYHGQVTWLLGHDLIDEPRAQRMLNCQPGDLGFKDEHPPCLENICPFCRRREHMYLATTLVERIAPKLRRTDRRNLRLVATILVDTVLARDVADDEALLTRRYQALHGRAEFIRTASCIEDGVLLAAVCPTHNTRPFVARDYGYGVKVSVLGVTSGNLHHEPGFIWEGAMPDEPDTVIALLERAHPPLYELQTRCPDDGAAAYNNLCLDRLRPFGAWRDILNEHWPGR
ncbi:MAG: hypothetical protein ACYSVY_03455 [Planctomycetota bacterium]|jgi:hypothetical protein